MNSNLNTLLANIIDALASAVAEKITPTPIDMDALTEAVTGSDAFSDEITSQIEDKVSDRVDRYMEYNADISSKVEDAIGDMDLVDYIDIGDLAKQVAESDTLRGAIDQEVRDRVDVAMENFDNTSVVTDSIVHYLDDNLDEHLDERLKVISDTIMAAKDASLGGMSEMQIRAIVREEMHTAFFAFASTLIKE